MTGDNKLYGLFLAFFVFALPGYSLAGRIQGIFPGKENTKLYISYFPPGPDNTKFSDSCIIDPEAKFEFIFPFNEPVLAMLRFDFTSSFDFVTDTGVVRIIPLYTNSSFSFSMIEAISPANKEYSAYKKLLQPESSFTTDSISVTKTYSFVKTKPGNAVLKAMLVYRKLMLRIPLKELKNIFADLEPDGRYSIYGIAILEYIQAHGNIKAGDSAPSFFNQVTPDGKTLKVEDFRGKYLLIDFWAAWCSPCRSENPHLVQLYRRFKQQNFEILGISLDRKKEEWVKAIDQDRLPWPQGSDIKYWDNECVQLYGINGIPFNVLLDTEGKIIAINPDIGTLEKRLMKIFPDKEKVQ